MAKILVIDFETHDPYIETMGPGWATATGEVLCVSLVVRDDDWSKAGTTYTLSLSNFDDIEVLKAEVFSSDIIVAHNAQYDVGYLCMLFGGTDWLKDKTLVDTAILARLYNNIEKDLRIPGSGYSLDYLSKKYLKQNKTTGTLGDLVLKHKLINCKDPTTKLSKTKADNYAKKNMKQLYALDPKVVEDYCLQDTELCKQLYEFYKPHISHDHIVFYSDLLKVVIKSRWNGVRVNSEALFNIKVQLQKQRDSILENLKLESGNPDFNPLSTADVAQVLLKTMSVLPKTEKGNFSITSGWLEEQENPICKSIVKYRVLEKLSRDFCDNILEMQSILPEHKKGFIYPTFNLLGAETGRMSCQGPNLQQIPNAKKHKDIGPLIRGAYVAAPGKLWASLDFAAQEPRLQVHYASSVGAEGADLLVAEYNNNPHIDLHTIVGQLTGLITEDMTKEEKENGRNQCKSINLGIAYGMGVTKLGNSLDLSMFQAKALLEQFHSKLPYLKELDKACKESLKKNGYIRTIGGRKLRIDPPVIINGEKKTFEYKALNKLIQGSSADQIMMCLIALDKAGFTVLSSVHDEINLEVNNLEEALRAKEIMENVLKLRVPVVAELSLGTSWGNGKKVENVK